MTKIFYDNPKIIERTFCGIRLIVIIQFYSFLFLLWGISQFGISLFKEKYTGDSDESFSFIMIIEGYGSAFLIAVRSKFAFLLASFYFVIRCAFVINRLSEENPDPRGFVMLKYSESLRMTYVVRAKGQPLYALKDYEWEESAKTNGLQLCSFLPRDYDFTLKRDYDYIRVEKAMYASLESVLQLSERSKEVILDESILISKGLNNFFNHWLQKRIDGLKFLSIRMRSYREFSVYKGIEQRISDATEEINYKSYTGDLYRLSPGKYLRRDDGVIASFFYNPSTRILNFGVVSKTK